MIRHHAEPKTFEEKVSAQLHEAKSHIEAIEASTKGKLAQADVDAVKSLKTTRHEIEKKSQQLRTAGEAEAAHIKAEIEADLAKFTAAWGNSARSSRANRPRSKRNSGPARVGEASTRNYLPQTNRSPDQEPPAECSDPSP